MQTSCIEDVTPARYANTWRPEERSTQRSDFYWRLHFYWRHIQNFIYSSAPLTDLMRKTNPWRRSDRDVPCFQMLKKTFSSTNCLGVPAPKAR